MTHAPDPSGMNRPLRVGLLMDSLDQPAWVHLLLERIVGSEFAQVELVILNQGKGDVRAPPRHLGERLMRYWRSRDELTYLALQRLDRMRFTPSPSALEAIDASHFVQGVPVLSVTPHETRFSDFFPDDAVDEIRGYQLDVLIRLGFRILRGGILEAARHGVWSYHHGDNRVNRGGPFGFWEVMLNWPSTGYLVQVLNEDLDGGLVLHRGSVRTHPLSHHLNRDGLLWRSAAALPRRMRELHRLGPEAFFGRYAHSSGLPAFYSQRLFRNPSNRELAGPLVKHVSRYVRRKVRATVWKEQWQLRYGLRDGPSASMWRLKPLVPPADRFWADPCVVPAADGYWVFFEEYMYDTSRGRISVLHVSEDGVVGRPEVALDLPYHLSYPFVFEHQGVHYMIPESATNASVDLYRCEQLPGPWIHERTLMQGTLADATLLEHGGRWWMFATDQPHPSVSLSEELHLFHADSPLATEWTPHAANPVVSDVTRARSAGRVLALDGRLIRPAQDCSVSYGHSIHFREITHLDPECYQERDAGSLRPDWDPRVRGIHTYAQSGRLTVVDARVETPRFGRRAGSDLGA